MRTSSWLLAAVLIGCWGDKPSTSGETATSTTSNLSTTGTSATATATATGTGTGGSQSSDCAAVVAAANGCANQAAGVLVDEAEYCAEVPGTADYSCALDVYANADCSARAEYADARFDAYRCLFGLDAVTPCAWYIVEANACLQQAATGTTPLDPTAFCEPYANLAEEPAIATIDAFLCAQEAFYRVDCTDPAAVSDASSAANQCILNGW